MEAILSETNTDIQNLEYLKFEPNQYTSSNKEQ